VNLRSGEEVAIKLEPLKSRHPQLLYEAKIYKGLAGSVGIPSIHWYGVQDAYTVMVLDLLGPSLEDLLNFCKGRLSLKTVLMIADQMINRLECVHSRNVIHRDVKPDNFLLGLGRRANQVNLIDFGLSKKYRDSKTQVHIPYREGKALTGTARYASINTHAGLEQSRRDDLEALGYVLIYLVKGCLPWQGLPSKTPKTKQERYDEIMQQKINTSLKDLCKDLPQQFEEYLTYCRKLQFEERPDYGYLRQLLRDAFAKEGFQLDFVYDWSLVGTGATSATTSAVHVEGGITRITRNIIRSCHQRPPPGSPVWRSRPSWMQWARHYWRQRPTTTGWLACWRQEEGKMPAKVQPQFPAEVETLYV